MNPVFKRWPGTKFQLKKEVKMEKKIKLSISDAMELRNEYDTHISALKDVLGKEEDVFSWEVKWSILKS